MAILQQCPICRRRQPVKKKACKCGEDLDKAKASRRVKYWISYYLANGKNRREYVGALEGLDGYSIKDARDALSKRRSQKREGRIFDMLPESKTTFNDLTTWYLNLEKTKEIKSFKTIHGYLKKFTAYLVNGIYRTLRRRTWKTIRFGVKKKAGSQAPLTMNLAL